MKIICVANNFSGLSQISAADEPVFFHKPDTSPLTHNRPFFIPDFCKQLFGCLTWIIRLDKLGKYVDEKFAHTYFHEIAAGINLYDAQKLAECQQNGNPWEIAKAEGFDGVEIDYEKIRNDLGLWDLFIAFEQFIKSYRWIRDNWLHRRELIQI